MIDRDCTKCGRPISSTNKTGLCHPCANPPSAIATAAKVTGWSSNNIRRWAKQHGEAAAIRMAHERTPPRRREAPARSVR